MIKLFIFLCSIFGIQKQEQKPIKPKVINMVNGRIMCCQVCGKPGSFTAIVDGKTICYCWKHFKNDWDGK